MATAASIYTDCFHRYASVDFRPTAMFGCPLQCDAFIQYSELLAPTRANPGQLQGPSMPDSFVIPADVIRSWRHLVLLLHIPLGTLPQQKL